MSCSQKTLDAKGVQLALIKLLGAKRVLIEDSKTEYYRTGWRSGSGSAVAVVFPNTLIEYWHVLTLCVEANCIVILQAANTGLTEGSTPNGTGYDREVVIINTLAMNKLILLGNGEQVISFPGATLHQLEIELKKIGRVPHSVIGSSSLGASIVGGIANNSGGALVKRGPAYTELSLYAKVDKNGNLQLVNNLDLELGNTPEEILTRLENSRFNTEETSSTKQASSAADYVKKIRQIDANTPSRYNADTSRLYEASGCAGKLAVFAVRVDTFVSPLKEQTFYVGTNNAATLTAIRRHMLSTFQHLPEVGEYLHRDLFDVAAKYGKDTFISIEKLGTAKMPKLFSLKSRIDSFLKKVPFVNDHFTDKLLQFASRCFPQHLPLRMRAFRELYAHHLIIKMSDDGIAEARQFLTQYFGNQPDAGDFFECTMIETQKAYLHRFVAAGAAIRYKLLNERKVGEMLALDIALRRNDSQWVEELPEHIAKYVDKALYYGHFFCHVFHQDYILKAGTDVKQVKADMLAFLDERGAKYPAEHNVGHVYDADEELKQFYRDLDPTNMFNPGVGNMEKHKRNCSCTGGLF